MENSDDPSLRHRVNSTMDRLRGVIAPFVQQSKSAAHAPNNPAQAEKWRQAANRLLDVVEEVTRLFEEFNMYGMDSGRNNNNYNKVIKIQLKHLFWL